MISHASAAVLHGLPVSPHSLAKVHAMWPFSPGRRATSNIHPHRGRLLDIDGVAVDGVAVTSVPRTLFDLARADDPRTAVAAADWALRTAACTRDDLAAVVARYATTPGRSRVGRILGFADGRSESVGESHARVVFAQLGLPDPDVQTDIVGVDGTICARVDFDFSIMRTIAEFDGRIKYGALLRTGQTASDAVFAEKLREDRIRETGRQVVRVVWDDLARPALLLRRFGAAFTAAGHSDWHPAIPRFVDNTERRGRFG